MHTAIEGLQLIEFESRATLSGAMDPSVSVRE